MPYDKELVRKYYPRSVQLGDGLEGLTRLEDSESGKLIDYSKLVEGSPGMGSTDQELLNSYRFAIKKAYSLADEARLAKDLKRQKAYMDYARANEDIVMSIKERLGQADQVGEMNKVLGR